MTNDKDPKVREFELRVEAWNTNAVSWPGFDNYLTTGEIIHTIEYSAYAEVVKERDQLDKILCERNRETVKATENYMRLCEKIEKLQAENARLKIALEYYANHAPITYTDKVRVNGGIVLHSEFSAVAILALSDQKE